MLLTLIQNISSIDFSLSLIGDALLDGKLKKIVGDPVTCNFLSSIFFEQIKTNKCG